MIRLLLVMAVVSAWVVAIALIAIQNAPAVSLTFLGLQSVAIPFGFLLAVSAAIGMVGTAGALALLKGERRPSSRKYQEFYEEP